MSANWRGCEGGFALFRVRRIDGEVENMAEYDLIIGMALLWMGRGEYPPTAAI
jgi:hypothetical protein